MNYIEQAKQYTGSDLENIFFRPMLTGESARELGVRVLYNMPQPTYVQLWDGGRNLLQKYTASGWTGGKAATKTEKAIQLSRVKAEIGFSAADYFSMVYEKVAALIGANEEEPPAKEDPAPDKPDSERSGGIFTPEQRQNRCAGILERHERISRNIDRKNR